MWSKNGEKCLSEVLARIDDVIPTEVVQQKILVDDHSTDNTVKIAEDFNWNVYLNPKGGLSSGANEALRHVDCDFFVSVEQDVVLAKDWWSKIPCLLEGERIAVASGVRIPDKPIALRKLQEYTTERYRKETKHKTSFVYGKTLDNTIYNTKIIRELGGFPKLKVSAGVDTVLVKVLYDREFIWAVDFNVKSIHLRQGLIDELKHYYWYGTCRKELSIILSERSEKFIDILLRTGFSPLRGLQVAWKQRCWQIAYVYPLIRLSSFWGVIRGFVNDNS